MSLNKVFLIGNVGKDPEIIDSASGRFAKFTLATTDRGYTKQDGTVIPDRTEWHNIVVNGSLVSVVDTWVKKGTKLFIEGKIRTRSYEKDGSTHYITEVTCFNLEMLGGKPETQSDNLF